MDTSRRIPFLLFFAFLLVPAFSQKDFKGWLKERPDFSIEPFVMVQLWSTYSMGQEVYNGATEQYEPVDDRMNVQLRRARLGFRMQPYERLKFTVVGAYDLVGRDLLSGTVGGTNNGGLPNFGIWDAFFQWKISKDSDAWHLTGGYFRPQISRESITSGWSVNSMEKSMSQNYIRRHLVGQGPGRAMGLNLGGLWLNEAANVGLNYNFGIFFPQQLDFDGNSVGPVFAPLTVGRLALQIGDPEMTSYKLGYEINYYGQRRGLSLGVSGAWQGGTRLFTSSYALQTDVLFNYGPFNFDADWNFMWRESLQETATPSFTYASNTGHVRMGYNLVVGGKVFLEPTLMVMQFNGATSAAEQAQAAAVGAFSGEDYTYDAGINWYLNKKKLKVLLHYTWHQGDYGDAGPGARVNQFFSQSGVGAIRRGNWLGLGLHAIF